MAVVLQDARKFADIGGSTMASLDVGSGPVVVLGHSFLWSAEMWEPQVRALSQHYRVIVPELWGHGKSGPLPPDTPTLKEVAQHQLDLLDALGVNQFALAGLSVGGMWGVELALLASARVVGLVLLDTFVGSEPAASKARYFSMLDTVQSVAALPDPLVDAILPLFFGSASLAHRPDLVAGFRTSMRAFERDRLLDSVVPLGRMTFARRDALADLQRLQMPALVITGAEDRARPPAEGKQMAAILGCPLVEIAGAGHIATLEAPDDVNQHLLAFLSEVFQRVG